MTLSLLHESTHPTKYPNTMCSFLADMSFAEDVNVIPEPVRLSSLQITGTWDQFFIKWDPVTNVNYDQVFYEVKIYDFSKMDFSEPVSALKLVIRVLVCVCERERINS